jgi:glucose/arabinose dehydrogenase
VSRLDMSHAARLVCAALAAGALVIVMSGCGTSAGAAGTAAAAARLQQVGTFSSPVSVAAPPGDPNRVFVVQQGGTIREVHDGHPQSRPFLDLGSKVAAGGERGLLSMAFAPDYATSHHFYVYYTANAPIVSHTGDIEVDRFTASSPDRASPSSRKRILTIPHHVQANHNGGQLQFGPDGMLYLGTGDGGGGGDTQGNGQNLTVSDAAANRSPLLAKILRIDPRRGGGFSKPAGNPFSGPAAAVWMLGLRNPWRFSFDRKTGAIVIGDVGQDLYEEIDYAASPGAGKAPGAGENFGWNLREGNHAFAAHNEKAGANFKTDPVIEEPHSAGWLAIIGGYVVRDPSLPALAGTYVYGDNAKGRLYGATLSASGASQVRDLGLAVPGLAGMGEDACGRVYLALLGGSVKRLVGRSGASRCTVALIKASRG